MSKTRPSSDWVQRSAHPGRVERIEAWFAGHGYEPHRHDTYSIGRTLAGVQSFNYHGALCHGMPGNTLVLHPDEVHDGMAGTDAGFRYRMAYIDPALIQQVLGGEPLPYIEGGLSSDPRLYRAAEPFVQAIDYSLDPLEEQDALYDLAMAMKAVAGKPRGRQRLDYPATERARAFIMAHLHEDITLDMLEHASGREPGACHGISGCCTAPAHIGSLPCAAWTRCERSSWTDSHSSMRLWRRVSTTRAT